MKPDKRVESRCLTDDTMRLSQSDLSPPTSSVDTSNQRPSLTKWQYQPYDSDCDSTSSQRRNSRLLSLPVECEGLEGLARGYIDRALTDGRVEVTIVGRRIRTYFLSHTANPSKCVEYILQVKVLPPSNQIHQTSPSEFIVFRRYSDFYELHSTLKRSMGKEHTAVAFPRKQVLGRWRCVT